MPINCYITNTLQHQRQAAKATNYAYDLEEEQTDPSGAPENAEPVVNEKDDDLNEKDDDLNEKDDDLNEKDDDLNKKDDDLNEKDDDLNDGSVDCGPTDVADDVVALPVSPNNAHPDEGSLTPNTSQPTESAPKTPPHEDSDQFDESRNSTLTSPPLLITATAGRSGGLLEMVAKRVALQSTAVKADMDKASDDLPPPPETKAESQGDAVEVASSDKENSVCVQRVLSDSGSELSDNDWLDEDLLPRRCV